MSAEASSVIDATTDSTDVEWEGSLGSPDAGHRHYFLVTAATSDAAIAAVRCALRDHGTFDSFAATEVQPPVGWKGLGRHGVDWASVSARQQLTELQQTLLENLLDDEEPTWLVLKDPGAGGDRKAAEAALGELERHGLVKRARRASGNPDSDPMELEDWWAITGPGWEMLGLIKRPWYARASSAQR